MPETANPRHFKIRLALGALMVSVLLAVTVGLTGRGQTMALTFVEYLEILLETHYWPVILIYVLSFSLIISLTLPAATLLTVGGGYLFGAWQGGAAALAAMTLGAGLTFLAMRLWGVEEETADLRQGRGRHLFELLDRNAVFYVTLLRVVPVAPCFAVNAGAALTRIDFPRFIIASMVGLAPSSMVYAGVGAGLNALIEARDVLGPGLLLEPQIALPLLGVVMMVGISWLLRRHLPGLAPEA